MRRIDQGYSVARAINASETRSRMTVREHTKSFRTRPEQPNRRLE